MKSFVKSLCCILLAVLMCVPVLACGDTGTDPTPPGGDGEVIEKAKRPTVDGVPYGEGRTLTINLWGDTPSGLDEVVAEYKRRTADIFAFDIEFKFSPLDQYKQNLTLNIGSSTSNLDLVFDAGWIYLDEWSRNGNYVRLDKYFDNDEYPGLKKAFPADYLDNNRFDGGLYAIPLTETFGSSNVAYYREDWRKEAAADGVTSLADGIDSPEQVEDYLYWVLENKQGVTPLICNRDGFGPYNLASGFEDQGDGLTVEQNNAIGVRSWQVGLDVNLTVYVDPETKTAKSAYMPFYQDSTALSRFPSQYQDSSKFTGNWQAIMRRVRTWYEDGIISKDVLNESDAMPKFRNGQGGMYVDDIANFVTHQSALQKIDPNAELEVFVYSRQEREMVQPNWGTDFRAWNYLAIPRSSQNEDIAMLFMDWLFSSRENHDLFQYGIEGKHWTRIDPTEEGGTYSALVTADHEPYTLNSYLLTWNPTYLRTPAGISEKAARFIEYVQDPDSYTTLIYSDFAFDATNIASELANPDFATYKTQHIPYYLGTQADPVAQFQQILDQRIANQKFQQDLAIIEAEFLSQLQDYLDNL